MTHRELLLYWSTAGFEILLCALVYLRNLKRRLPFFTVHVTLLLTFTMANQIVYYYFGFRSPAAYYFSWMTVGAIVITRFLAIAELCRYELRAYEGVWALAWRVLAVLGVFFLAHAAVDAWGQLNRLTIYELTIERDIEITSIVILLAMLLIRNYYGLTLEPLHNWIALGMCIVCVTDVLNNTILRDAFNGYLSSWFHLDYASTWSDMRSRVQHVMDLWNLIRTAGIILAMSVWCLALRRPLPAPAKTPVLLPREIYQELSPAVNLRLRAFNDRLLEMLRS